MAFDTASPSLVSRVGDLLRVTISATTEPDTDSVDKWLQEGAIEFYRIAPESVIFKFADDTTPTVTLDANKGASVASPVNMLRLLGVEFGLSVSALGNVDIVDERTGRYYLRTGMEDLGYFVAWQESAKIRVNYTEDAVGTQTIRLVYLDTPTTSDEFPEELFHHIINYAVARARTVETDDPGYVSAWQQEIRSL